MRENRGEGPGLGGRGKKKWGGGQKPTKLGNDEKKR